VFVIEWPWRDDNQYKCEGRATECNKRDVERLRYEAQQERHDGDYNECNPGGLVSYLLPFKVNFALDGTLECAGHGELGRMCVFVARNRNSRHGFL